MPSKKKTPMPYLVGARVKSRLTFSQELRKGSRGEVTRVLARKMYDVSFDKKANGHPMVPPVRDTLSEADLEPE